MSDKNINYSLAELRDTNRANVRSQRQESRESVLRQRRLKLSEVENFFQDITTDQFKELIQKIREKKVPLEVLQKIKTACSNYEYIEIFFRINGALNSLISILVGNDAQKQLEAAACLTNLAYGSHKASLKVAKEAGAYLVSLINGGSYYLQDQCSWAAGNIASDCIECFSILKAQGIIPALLNALKSPMSHVIQSAVFALNACTKYEDPDVIEIMKCDLPNTLIDLIGQQNVLRSIVVDAAFILVNCLYLAVLNNLEIVNQDTAQVILACLSKTMHSKELDIAAAVPLVRCLGYLTTSDYVCKHIALKSDFHYYATLLLQSECYHLKKEVLWVLTNILVSEDFISEDFTDVTKVLEIIKMFLNPLNPVVLQVLYYLSCLVSIKQKMYSPLITQEIDFKIASLSVCGKEEIENASRTFLSIIRTGPADI